MTKRHFDIDFEVKAEKTKVKVGLRRYPKQFFFVQLFGQLVEACVCTLFPCTGNSGELHKLSFIMENKHFHKYIDKF